MARREVERRSGLAGSQISQTQRVMERSREKQAVEQTDGRGRPGHGGTVGRDSAGRSKATYNISLAAQEIARAIAEQEEVSQADIVEAALLVFRSAWQAGRVDLFPYKVLTRSLKVSWRLELPAEIDLFS